MPDTKLITLLSTIRAAIDLYLEHAEVDGAVAIAAAPMRSPASREPEGVTLTAAVGGNGASATERVRAELIQEMIERTGYPEELLEPDLDLEGDLGIDTVKQVAILSSVRGRLGLDIDPEFRLRDHNTIRKMAAHIAGRLELIAH